LPKREHTLMTCDCGRVACIICDGGLRVCKTCLCIEGAWTSECPRNRIPQATLDRVYFGEIDFVGGEWKQQTSPNSLAGLKAQAMRIQKRKEAQVV